jgi:hypothetical protein
MKLSYALTLPTALLLACTSAHALPGDADADGAVTVVDAAIVSRLASQDPAPSGDSYAAADVAGPFEGYRDNQIDWRDATRVLRAAGGLETIPDAPEDRLGAVRDNIAVTADTSKDYAFQDTPPPSETAYPVSGHVNGPLLNWWVSPLGFYHSNDTGGATRFAAYPDANGDYKVLLPANDYSLYYFGDVTETAPSGTLNWQYNTRIGDPIGVSGPLTLNVTAPPPPARGEIAGAIQAANLSPTHIYITSSGDADPARSFLTATGLVGTEAYTLVGAPATYHLFVEADYQADPAVKVGWQGWNTVDMTADSTVGPTIALPAVVPMAFDFAAPAGTAVTDVYLRHQDYRNGWLDLTSVLEPGTHRVQTAFTAGWSEVYVTLSLDGPGAGQRTVQYFTRLNLPAEGGEQTVQLPPLPQMFTFSGRVTLPDGSPARGAAMTLIEITSDINQPSPYNMRANATTDSEGRFSTALTPGTY